MEIYQMDYCLYCDRPIEPDLGWYELLFGPEERLLCQKCEGKLEKIEGQTCLLCGRSREGQDSQLFKEDICYDCLRWESNPKWKGVLAKNVSLYEYNSFMADFIARYKYRGDYVLAKVFSKDIQMKISSLDYDVIIPIPLSKERLYERGFNQAEALVKEAGFGVVQVLSRKHTEKQSKKSREERIHLEDIFKVKDEGRALIKGKLVLLFDDIYTTGSTLRHAARALLDSGAKKVISLTLARG